MGNLNDGIPKHAANVTPSDTTQLTIHSIVVGGPGNLVLFTEGGETVTFAVVAGQTVVQRATKVMQATTATGLVRQWS